MGLKKPPKGVVLEPLTNCVTPDCLQTSRKAYNDKGEVVEGTAVIQAYEMYYTKVTLTSNQNQDKEGTFFNYFKLPNTNNLYVPLRDSSFKLTGAWCDVYNSVDAVFNNIFIVNQLHVSSYISIGVWGESVRIRISREICTGASEANFIFLKEK